MTPARRKSRSGRPVGRRRRPHPRGIRPSSRTFHVAGGPAALDFYKKAFGAKELARQVTPDGKLVHGRLRIGDSIVMMSDVFPGAGVASPAAVGTDDRYPAPLFEERRRALGPRRSHRREGDNAAREPVLGRAVRAPARPVRPPLVALDAGEDRPGPRRPRSRRTRWPRSLPASTRTRNRRSRTSGPVRPPRWGAAQPVRMARPGTEGGGSSDVDSTGS